jgi:hypothetical protein
VKCPDTPREFPAVQVSVRDNGPGLSAEEKRRIFEPFFTNKPQGSGLGMAIADRIIRAHGGQFTVGYLVKPVKEADLRAAIAVGLARFQNIQALATESADLRRSLEDRKLTDRAKGIIMKWLRLDEDEAYRRLRKLASNHNRKLIEVLQEVVQADAVFQEWDRV